MITSQQFKRLTIDLRRVLTTHRRNKRRLDNALRRYVLNKKKNFETFRQLLRKAAIDPDYPIIPKLYPTAAEIMKLLDKHKALIAVIQHPEDSRYARFDIGSTKNEWAIYSTFLRVLREAQSYGHEHWTGQGGARSGSGRKPISASQQKKVLARKNRLKRVANEVKDMAAINKDYLVSLETDRQNRIEPGALAKFIYDYRAGKTTPAKWAKQFAHYELTGRWGKGAALEKYIK